MNSEGRIQRPALGKKFRVVSLNNPDLITEVCGDLENTVVRTRQDGGERVTHDVGSNPWHALGLHVFGEWPFKIPSVTVAAMLLLGMQHVGLTQTVLVSDKGEELTSHRNTSLLPVLKLDCGGFPQMQDASAKVKPERARLDDFKGTQTSVKPAEQNELQILSFAFANQLCDQLGRAEVFSGAAHRSTYLETQAGVITNGLLNVSAPVEEAPNCHHVPESGRGGGLLNPLLIVPAHPGGIDISGPNPSAPFSEREQHVILGTSRRLGPAAAFTAIVPSYHVSDEASNRVRYQVAGFDARPVPFLTGFANRFIQVAGAERNEVTLAILLNGEPVNTAPLVDSFSERAQAHVTVFLSHFSTLHNVTARAVEDFVTGVYGARTRNLRRDRIVFPIESVTLSASHTLSGAPPSHLVASPARRKQAGRTKTPNTFSGGLNAGNGVPENNQARPPAENLYPSVSPLSTLLVTKKEQEIRCE